VTAIARYKQILNSSEDDQVKAWILSRIARCRVKQKESAKALSTYHLIAADFPSMLTEVH